MIYIACALHCEAKPVIDKYKLKLDRVASYPVFSNDSMHLVVSGLGKLEMASAVSYLYAHCGERRNAAWLNYGVAGHGSITRGSLLNINKIIDERSGKSWYPTRMENMPGISAELISVDVPETNYPPAAAVDMEASAFVSVALRYTIVDMLQVIKIVSDNSGADIEKIDKSMVSDLIQTQLPRLDASIQWLLQRQQHYHEIYGAAEELQGFLEKWNFTLYQRNELKKLFSKANALNLSLLAQEYADAKTAKHVLHSMQQSINAVAVDF